MKFRSVTLSALAILGMAVGASAAPISGTFSLANTSGGGVTITPTTIDWFDPVGPPNGGFVVSTSANPAVAQSFFGLDGTTGLELDLNTLFQTVGAPFPLAGNNTNLAGEGVVLADFLTFTAAPNIRFDLNFINPGVFGAGQCGLAAAAGQVCTLPGTPFNLMNLTATSSSASFALSGFVRNSNDGLLSTFTGLYTTQFTTNFQELINDLQSGPGCATSTVGGCGFVTNTYSGTFTATITPVSSVPEPMTLLTFGAGSLFIARQRRKAAKKN